MPPWNAAGTRVSSAPVIAAGSVKVSCPAVPLMSRSGSSAPSTSDSDGSLSIPVQNDSSSIRVGSCACAASRCAQRRNEVPRGGSDGSSPCAQSPPRPPPGPAPGCATTLRRPPGGGWSAADDRYALRTGIEPDRLHHRACGRRQPQLGRQRLLADGGAQRSLIHAGDIDAMQALAGLHGIRRCDLQGPLGALSLLRCRRSRNAS